MHVNFNKPSNLSDKKKIYLKITANRKAIVQLRLSLTPQPFRIWISQKPLHIYNYTCNTLLRFLYSDLQTVSQSPSTVYVGHILPQEYLQVPGKMPITSFQYEIDVAENFVFTTASFSMSPHSPSDECQLILITVVKWAHTSRNLKELIT